MHTYILLKRIIVNIQVFPPQHKPHKRTTSRNQQKLYFPKSRLDFYSPNQNNAIQTSFSENFNLPWLHLGMYLTAWEPSCNQD